MKYLVAILVFLCCTLTLSAQNDCPEALVICGDSDYIGLSATGPGIQELIGTNDCSSAENNSIWLELTIKTGGTLGFLLTPTSNEIEVDFDFFIYGPDVACDSIGHAVRCSTTNPQNAGSESNLTGMNDTETDIAEGPGSHGNNFINWFTVQSGEVYYLVIDRPEGSSDFSLHWTGTARFHPIPVFNNPGNIPIDLQVCDKDGTDDGINQFNLPTHAAMFIGNQNNVELTFHHNIDDVTNGANPINAAVPYVNTVNNEMIYMRMTNTITGCFSIESFKLIVNSLPVFNNPENISLNQVKCDTDSLNDGINIFNLGLHSDMLIGGQDATLTFHRDLNDAVGGINAIVNYAAFVNISSPQVIYMRMTNNSTGCFSTQSFEILANMLPVFNLSSSLLHLTECDTDGTDDGFFSFDLTQHAEILTGGQPDIVITYFTDLAGAQGNVNTIPTPTAYTNTSNPQTIYMRMENTLTGCFSTGMFDIKVNSLPVFNNPQNIVLDMEACDTDGTNNGSFTFNLTQHAPMLIGGQNNVTLTYHTGQTEADGGINAIPDPSNFMNSVSPQTIYMRLTNNSTGCYRILTFQVKAIMLPLFLNPQNIPLDIEECDIDGTDDDTFIFNLTRHAAMLKGGNPNIQLSYYENLTNAQSGSNPITNPASYSNTSNPQTIYMRMVNTATGCINYKEFNISVNKLPVFNNPQQVSLDMVLCDADGVADQKIAFNLTQHAPMLIGAQTGAAITYHESPGAAHAGTNPIATPTAYVNLVSPQTIYMRITNTATGCFITGHFTIKVNPVPVFNNPQNIPLKLEQCDSDNIDDQSSVFNLAIHAPMFLGSQQGMLLSYYTSASDAASGNNPIGPAAFRNTSNPQTIYVRMLNITTGCFAITSFDIEVAELLDAGEPDDLSLCDTNSNGLQVFDLSQNNTLLQAGNTATSVRYYHTQADAMNEVNELPLHYQNAAPYTTETVWARLENVGGCIGYDIKSFTIDILRIPDIVFTTDVVDFTSSNNSITIVLPAIADYEFSLDGENYQDSNIFSGLEPGFYTVYIRARNNCKEVTKDVVILNYPKYFTPNGDGTNEYWQVDYLFLKPEAKVTIFDRYGKVITAFKGTSQGWDGTYNNHRLPATDYWFVLELEDGRLVKAHFSLLR